jgi:hypothetical protein
MFGYRPRTCGHFVAALLLALLAGPAALSGNARAQQPVGLELVLLIDVSASVNEEEFALQARGLAAAFASAEVLEAIRDTGGGVATTVIQWADGEHQSTAVDWTLIETEADALWLAEQLAAMPRLIDGGHTALGNALEVGLHEILANPYHGLRRVIDLSGDGRALRSAREEVLSHGIVINGLAILNELPLLESYFRHKLIGGEDAFVLPATDYVDFQRAITEKLAREIRFMPVTELAPPLSTVRAAQTVP